MSINQAFCDLFSNNKHALNYIKNKNVNLDLMHEDEMEMFEMEVWHYLQSNNKMHNPHAFIFPQDDNYTVVMHSTKKSMCAHTHINSLSDGIFYIRMFYVDKKYRGQGVGVRLFKKLELAAKMLKAKSIELQYTSNSRNFWLNMGFKDMYRSDCRMIKHLL